MTSYIRFYEDLCANQTRCICNNSKLWFNIKLRKLCQTKEEAYRIGDRAVYEQARNTLTREI